MRLFENAENIIEEQRQNNIRFENMLEFCMSNGIKLTSDQVYNLKEVCCGDNCAPSSDNNQIDDKEFKTTANSQDDEIIDAAKYDSSQKGVDPCPQHIEDAIEREEKNDEFVNDYDEDVKKNESSDIYSELVNACIESGQIITPDMIESMKDICGN